MAEKRGPGRPRSEATRQAILKAAIREVESRGYRATTIEGIAAAAGAGKQTIYRWWDSKADLVLDAVLDRAAATIPVPDCGTLRRDLPAFLTTTFRQRWQGPLVAKLMAESVLDPVFGEAFRRRFLFARRSVLRGIFERAVERGELSRSHDMEMLIDVVFGVLWYRLLVGHQALDDAAAAQLAGLVLRAAEDSQVGAT